MNSRQPITFRIWLQSVAFRLLLFFAGWLILTGGRLSDLLFVVLLLLIVAAVSLWIVPPREWRFHPVGTLQFLPYFLWTALRGGMDVARRVFAVSMPIAPGFVTLRIKATEKQRLLAALIVSLLPGTASCELSEEKIVVHTLDKNLPVEKNLRDLLSRIVRVVD